jgi:hypothetical protein
MPRADNTDDASASCEALRLQLRFAYHVFRLLMSAREDHNDFTGAAMTQTTQLSFVGSKFFGSIFCRHWNLFDFTWQVQNAG